MTPGLVDIHVHVFAGTGERRSYAGDNSVYPDGFTFRAGVTAVADAGCAGWRNFDDFKRLVIDRSRTRVFAFLNIVGHGMRGSRYEQDVADMQARPAAEMAMRHKGLIVGIKTAHYMGRDFTAVERAVEAGTIADIPVMVNFGRAYPEKSLAELLTKKLRPGDIYTHVYSGLRGELDPSGRANPALFEGRKRGVIFDVGHGGGSFVWRVAVPIIERGLPARLDLDRPACQRHEQRHEGHAERDEQVPGAGDAARGGDPALDLEPGPRDQAGATRPPLRGSCRRTWPCCGSSRATSASWTSTAPACAATQKLTCEMTLRDGKIVYELNGLSRPDWVTLPKNYRATGDPRWDGIRSSSGGRRASPGDDVPAGPDAARPADDRPRGRAWNAGTDYDPLSPPLPSEARR